MSERRSPATRMQTMKICIAVATFGAIVSVSPWWDSLVWFFGACMGFVVGLPIDDAEPRTDG